LVVGWLFALGRHLFRRTVPGLDHAFRRRFDSFGGQGKLGRFLAQHSFAAYILHSYVVTGVMVALGGLDLPILLKVGLGSVVAVPLCFAVAYLVRKIPGVSRVL
jgi:hypothetical protein